MTTRKRILEAFRELTSDGEVLRRFWSRSQICDTMDVHRYMHACKHAGIVTLLLITALLMSSSSCLVFPAHAKVSMSVSIEPDVASAIADAERRIILCYQAIAAADNVGANVTTLLARLNEAGWQLSMAQWAYEQGDLDSARSYTLLSQQKLEGLAAEAEISKETASDQQYRDFMVNVVGSVAGALVVMCGGFGVWSLLTRRPE